MLWVTQLVGSESGFRTKGCKACRSPPSEPPSGLSFLNADRSPSPQGRGPDEKGSAKDPTTGQSRKRRKQAPQNGDGVEPEQCVHGTKEGEKSDPRIRKAKWQKRTRVTRGAAACGDLHRRSSRTGPGRRRPEPQGSDKSPAHRPYPLPPTRPESPIADAWDVPEGSTRPPSPAGPPSAAPDPDRAPRRGAPQSRRPAAGLRARPAGRSAALQTEHERKACNQRPQGAGEGGALTSWRQGSAAVPGGAGPRFLLALRSFAG